MRRLLYLYPFLAFGLLMSLAACNDIPKFSETPEIKVSKVTLYRGASIDSIALELSFRDGDGDIGLNDEEKVGQYAMYLPGPTGEPDSSVLNPHYYNLSVGVFFWNKDKLQFDSIPPKISQTARGTPLMESRPYSGTIRPITTRREPIEGNIRYVISGIFYEDHFPGFPPLYPMTRKGDKFYVKVHLTDRALHSSARVQSNMITTP